MAMSIFASSIMAMTPNLRQALQVALTRVHQALVDLSRETLLDLLHQRQLLGPQALTKSAMG
jgi:hypothetical protein